MSESSKGDRVHQIQEAASLLHGVAERVGSTGVDAEFVRAQSRIILEAVGREEDHPPLFGDKTLIEFLNRPGVQVLSGAAGSSALTPEKVVGFMIDGRTIWVEGDDAVDALKKAIVKDDEMRERLQSFDRQIGPAS